MRRWLGALWFQVLVGTIGGILLGLVAPKAADAMKPLGDLFVALVRMLIAPVIFCTLVHGIAAMRDMARLGRVALKALVYFEAVTLLALVLALAVVDLWQPGAGMHVDAAKLDTSLLPSVVQGPHGFLPFVLRVIPTTFVSGLTSGEVLQTLLVAVLFGIGLTLAGEAAQPVERLIGQAGQVFFRIVGLVMYVAPIGAFGAIAFTVGHFGGASLIRLAALLLEFYAVSALFTLVVLGLLARLVGVSLWRLMGYLRDEIAVVAATTSTETVLPRLMEKLEALGCPEEIVGLVVPTGYSFNLDGTCLYLVTAAMFLAQATDTHLGLGQQLSLIAILLLSSKGAAGVAGAAFVVLAATLAALGTVPVASVALVLGIHRLMAEALTFVNLIGNSLATILVSAWKARSTVSACRRPLQPAPVLLPLPSVLRQPALNHDKR